MCSLINKQLLLTAYAYLFIMEQQEGQQGSEALQVESVKRVWSTLTEKVKKALTKKSVNAKDTKRLVNPDEKCPGELVTVIHQTAEGKYKVMNARSQPVGPAWFVEPGELEREEAIVDRVEWLDHMELEKLMAMYPENEPHLDSKMNNAWKHFGSLKGINACVCAERRKFLGAQKAFVSDEEFQVWIRDRNADPDQEGPANLVKNWLNYVLWQIKQIVETIDAEKERTATLTKLRKSVVECKLMSEEAFDDEAMRAVKAKRTKNIKA